MNISKKLFLENISRRQKSMKYYPKGKELVTPGPDEYTGQHMRYHICLISHDSLARPVELF